MSDLFDELIEKWDMDLFSSFRKFAKLVVGRFNQLERKLGAVQMALQDDINALLAADDAAMKSLGDRVSATAQGLTDEIAALKAEQPQLDTVGLSKHLQDLADMANSIDPATPPVVLPPVVTEPPVVPTDPPVLADQSPPAESPPIPGAAASDPVFTHDGPVTADELATWPEVGLAPDGTQLFSWNGPGPAPADMSGSPWHTYVGPRV